VARNRKRAKERRARRPQPVPGGAPERRDDAPSPLGHATPDVELAEAQLAIGRPNLGEPDTSIDGDGDGAVDASVEDRIDVDEEPDQELSEDEFELEEDEADAALGGPPVDGPPRRRAEVAASTGTAVERRPSLRHRIVNFLQGSWRELQRVQWPDRSQVIQATSVVIGFVIVAGVFLGVADFLSGKLINYILK